MKVFCPHIQGLCDEGYPGLKDHQCIMWDEEQGVCLMREAVKYSVAASRMQAEITAKFQAQKILRG